MKKVYISLIILSLSLASTEAELQKSNEEKICFSAEAELNTLHQLVDEYLEKRVFFNELESGVLKLIDETENLNLKLQGFTVLGTFAFEEKLYERVDFYKSLHYECLVWLGDDVDLGQSYAWHREF